MAERHVRVTFQPSGRAVRVLPGTKVLEAAGEAGLTIQTPCGGTGTCGKCRVQITAGPCPPGEADRKTFSDQQLSEGWRLACQTEICGETTISLPASSLFADGQQILTAAQAATEVAPAVRKVHVQLAPPALGDSKADLLRLEEQLGAIEVDLAVLAKLPRLLREGGFAGTAVLADGRLIDFEPGDTTRQCFGVAVDVGTTTLVAALLDLTSGKELAVASGLNPQVSFGDDVLSRIKLAAGGLRQAQAATSFSRGGLERLRSAVVGAVNELTGQLCGQAAAQRANIYEVALAGNTTMQHLFCGIDPAALGQVPFVPACTRAMMLPAAELGIDIHPRGSAYVFPCIGGFVGGDTVAGLLSSGLVELPGPAMLVDIGTNGEIAVACDGRILVASTAAGPAFEGARISIGMRAMSGAVEKVVFDGDVHCGVIGDSPPTGLCGSGLIDLAAELLAAGIVTPQGRLLPPAELPAGLPKALRDRVGQDSAGQTRFLLADSRSGAASPLAVTQRDIRELQLATAAIRAGTSILLRRAGLESSELQQVLVAGGFGGFIRRSSAQRIGLLPGGLDHRRIRYIGDACLAGAKWALLSTRLRAQAEQLAREADHVDLSQDKQFHDEFAEAMTFPEAS